MREDIQTAPKQQENPQNARKPRGTRGQRSDPVWPAPETTRPTPIKKEPPWLMASQSPFKTAKNCPTTLEQLFSGAPCCAPQGRKLALGASLGLWFGSNAGRCRTSAAPQKSHDNENQEKDNENQEQDWQCRRGCDRPSRARGYVYKIGSMQSPVHEVRATPRLLVNETN